MSTLRIEHPNGDTLKTIDLPEGTVFKLGRDDVGFLDNIDRLEVVVPHDFSSTELSSDEQDARMTAAAHGYFDGVEDA